MEHVAYSGVSYLCSGCGSQLSWDYMTGQKWHDGVRPTMYCYQSDCPLREKRFYVPSIRLEEVPDAEAGSETKTPRW